MTSAAPFAPAFDCVEQHELLRDDIMAAIDEVLSSGRLILGPRVEAFEHAFVGHLGVEGHAVGVANGTDALAAALWTLAVGPDDEVITVANAAVPTAVAIRQVGATPVFCDADRQSLLVDLDQLEALIGPRTKAIIAVHLFGAAIDMDALVELCERRGVALVEDCAQACGTTWRGRHVGTFGDIGCFSFYPTKNLGACGDAGLCFTRHAWLAGALRQIRGYGCDDNRVCVRPGMNSRLDELQAAILSVKLAHLPQWLARRRRVAGWYDRGLPGTIARPSVAAAASHSYHLYPIAVARRAALLRRLEAENIGYGIHYPVPLHHMPGLLPACAAPLALPVAERWCRETVSLPCYPELAREAVQWICAVLHDFVDRSC